MPFRSSAVLVNFICINMRNGHDLFSLGRNLILKVIQFPVQKSIYIKNGNLLHAEEIAYSFL